MIRRTKKPDKLGDVLFRIKRGLAGYVSYLAACEMNQAFSEYVLYEPILRILTAQGYSVECEVACPGLPKGEGPGDFKRIDFVADNRDSRFAIEVKWAKRKTIDVKNDYNKLQAYAECNKQSSSFLCVFGTKSILKNIKLKKVAFRNAEMRFMPSFAERDTGAGSMSCKKENHRGDEQESLRCL